MRKPFPRPSAVQHKSLKYTIILHIVCIYFNDLEIIPFICPL